MRTLIRFSAILLVMTVSLTISAQDLNKKTMVKIKEQVKEMVDVMGLDTNQQAKIVEIKKQQNIERNALIKKMDRESPEFKSEVKKINKVAWENVTAVCTKEQIKKWNSREKE